MLLYYLFIYREKKMQEAEDEISANRNLVQHNIRELLDSSLPAQISQLEESTVSLERVAAYCEANYIQSQNKATSLAETKRYALQSLASVAYLVGELSRSLMHALELEQMNVAQKTSEIQNITQLVTIQKEKAARREIGKLTTAKNINKQNKITYPATEERTPRYQRTAIDFSILDGIGHGRRAPPNNNEYGSIGNASGGGYAAPIAGGIYGEKLQINRTNSTTSGESGTGSGSGGSAGMQQQQIGPFYDHYARTGNHGTLTRGSIRSAIGNNMHDQYRVPQPIPSALQLQNHYQSMQQPLMGIDQQQRYASTMGLNGNSNGGQINMINHNNHYEYEQYGTLRAPQQQIVNYTCANGQAMGGHTGNRSVDQMNNSADYSDDGLPLPPPLLLVGQGPPQQEQPRQNIQEDGFPLPPPPHPQILSGTNNQQQNLSNVNAADWIPQQYIERAICLYDYESRNQDELRLYQGAIVYILRKNEDGWFEGVMDGITGLFPGNYVQRISN